VPKKRRATPTEAALARALKNTAQFLADNTPDYFTAKAGREALDTALETLEYVTNALVTVRRLDPDERPGIGFGSDVIDGPECDSSYSSDHGQDIDYGSEAERPHG
jgi:hypothetical protein